MMKFDKSLELYERAKRSLAGGVNTNSADQRIALAALLREG